MSASRHFTEPGKTSMTECWADKSRFSYTKQQYELVACGAPTSLRSGLCPWHALEILPAPIHEDSVPVPPTADPSRPARKARLHG